MAARKRANKTKVTKKTLQRVAKKIPPRPPRAFIFMLRHGQAEGNTVDRFNGSRIDVPLTNRGMAQSGYMAAHFPFRPAAIFSSPLARAMQTAKPLAARFGMPIIRLPQAMEQDYGSLSGKTRKELAAPKYRRYFHFEKNGHMYTLHSPGGGESWEDLKKRADNMLRWLDKHYAGQKVVVVSHSDFINCVYGVRNRLSDKEAWRRRDVANCGAVRL